MVSRIGISGSSWADYRAKTADAAAQGKLGLAAAQAYLQASSVVTPATTPTPTVYQPLPASQDGQEETGASSDQASQGNSNNSFTSFQSAADFSQMLAAQEAGSQTLQAEAKPQTQPAQSQLATGRALGAYAATLSLTEDPSALEMQSPGWSGSTAPGQTVRLLA